VDSAKLGAWAADLYATHARAIADLVGAAEVPQISVRVERSGPGAAWTSGDRVFLSARWFAEHPEDAGGCLHEFTHAIMQAPVYDDSTRWLIEGIADWVRDRLGHDAPWTFAHFEHGKATAGYQETAHFLFWLDDRVPGSVRELARRLSTGTYAERAFEELHGEPLAALVSKYEAAQGA
jgi:basic secretory peptidase family protein